METEEFYGELTIQHFIPTGAINPEALLNAWRRCSGFDGMAAIEFKASHNALIFWTSDFPTDLAQEELAGFIAGYVAACEDARKAADARMMDMLGEIFEGDDDTLILSDDDSPQIMPGPDQFR